MCGIVGIANASEPVDREALERRAGRLSHRGPDDAGTWVSADGRVGLSHRRLAILDLSPTAHQPMVSEDGRCAMVYNGEIYNFRALRAELERLGYAFRGHGDAEVVVAAYHAWGEKCVTRFDGMFALAVYDRGGPGERSSIFLARDRAGEKPLYYHADARRFQFASELKALDVPWEIDGQALNYYLAVGYVPGDMCLAQGVRKLPPAHAARLDAETHELTVWRYWELPPNAADPEVDPEELTDHLEALLLRSVQARLISDVPLGVLLSGGLDSSLIVAAAARQTSRPIRTFTVSFPGTRFDEAAHARCVADHFGTEHHVLEVRQPSLETLDEIAPLVDEPIADSSLIPSFIVSRLTRRHVTVALGGDGGDELFGGYGDYPTSLGDQRRWGWVPGPLLNAVGRATALLPAGVRGRNRITSVRNGPLYQMAWGTPYFDTTLRRRILTRGQVAALGGGLDEPERWLAGLLQDGADPVDRMTRTHFRSILPDDFLVKVDRASMAHGLELRAPLLDHRLVEFAFSRVPSRWKVQDGQSRRLQKRLARRWLPSALDMERKQGFSVPLDDWLRQDRCRTVHEIMPHLPEAIDRGDVLRLIDGQLRGRANSARLHALTMLGLAARNLGGR